MWNNLVEKALEVGVSYYEVRTDEDEQMLKNAVNQGILKCSMKYPAHGPYSFKAWFWEAK